MEALIISALRGLARFVVESPPYNLLDRRAETERIPLCQKYGRGRAAVVAAGDGHAGGAIPG
jgi:aryl-alcohol dehydrogenase-like predicted oxidoreductase